MSLQQVHFRVNDAATGKPTPVRLRITDAHGAYYAPFGRLTDFATGVNQDVGGNVQIGVKKWAYIDGACEILLPPGPLHIEIAKGPEYTPIDEDVTLLAGKMALRFEIARWSDMRKEGWYSGDTRVHFLSPDAALLEGQAEDVAVVNLLAKETTITDSFGKTHQATPNILAFGGQAFVRQAGGCGVAVNTQNCHPQLGSLGLLYCHRVVFPLSFTDEDWTFDDWCGQCHRKKGLVVWTDSQSQISNIGFGAPLADLVLGNIDALELTKWEVASNTVMSLCYDLCDANFGVPIVGASAKDSNATVLGCARTYAFLGSDQAFTFSNWIEAVRSGKTYVSNGPLLNWTVNGEVPSSVLELSPVKNVLRIRVEARSMVYFEHLELLWNGDSIEVAHPISTSPYRAEIECEMTVEESGNLAVCVTSDRVAGELTFAHTSNVAVRRADFPRRVNPIAIQRLAHPLDGLATWHRNKHASRLLRVVDEARTLLSKKLS